MTTLRSSRFADFNAGTTLIEPMQLIRALGSRKNHDKAAMLEVFECRVEVWTLAPAIAMLKLMEDRADNSVWAHSGYTPLAATFSYFEMIGKILNPGARKAGTAAPDFNYGFCDVYDDWAKGQAGRSDKDVPDVRQFRDRVRNGLYHLGFTKSHLYIHHQPDRWPHDFTIELQNAEPYYFVNPHNMTRRILDHFPTLMSRLRAADEQGPLMTQFKKFYVDFHEG